MSPEQCRGDQVDGRADIYSFGVVCFECLTGQRPFVGDSSTAVLVAHLTQPPPPMSRVAASLPAELDAPVLGMLAKEPAGRPSSAGAALDDLERAAREAGLTPREGLPWLPRPTSETPAEPGMGSAVTVAESGMREGQREAEPAPRRARLVVGVGALAVLAALASTYWFTSRPVSVESKTAAPAHALPAEPPSPSRTADKAAGAETSQPATPAQPVAAPAPAPAAPVPPSQPERQVALIVRGAPDGAAVLLGDRKLGVTPGPILLPYGEQPVVLKVVVPGSAPKTLSVTPSAPLDVALPSEKSSRARSKRGALPHDLENPF
jgi:hypothetical protein